MFTNYNHLKFDLEKTDINLTEDSVPWFLISLLKKYKQINFLCKSNEEIISLSNKINILCPQIQILCFPSFDCPIFSSISPTSNNKAHRISTLIELSKNDFDKRIILYSLDSLFLKILPKDVFKNRYLILEKKKNKSVTVENITHFLKNNSYFRVETVRQKGEFSIRGNIIDFFSPNNGYPTRIDSFASEIESIKKFDPISQLSFDRKEKTILIPASEVILNEKSIQKFRVNFRTFNIKNKNEYYENISQGINVDGIEQFLPLMSDNPECFLDYLKSGVFILEHNYKNLILEANEKISKDFLYSFDSTSLIKRFLEDSETLIKKLICSNKIEVSNILDLDKKVFKTVSKKISNIEKIKNENDINSFINFAEELLKKNDLLITIKNDSSMQKFKKYFKINLQEKICFKKINIENSFFNPVENQRGLAVINDSELFGKKVYKDTKKEIKTDNIITEISSLSEGDLVVHNEHGIGKYLGLRSILIYESKHECMEIEYYGCDKLLIPVENLDLISRYGNKDINISLDKLGSQGWQLRKASIKEKVKIIAHDLISIAAKREIRKGKIMISNDEIYDEFSNRFQYAETSDQLKAIFDVESDLSSGKPMDRLICGDVGFGKTEIAMRAAFISVLSGYQVAFLCPTTLLVNQHFKNFSERFSDFKIKINKISRFNSTSEKIKIVDELEKGNIEILIGTHALFNDEINFKNLGLLIIDEEQSFGVSQKEKLKKIRSEIHILTLTATPIPRTLQSAILGIKDISIIKTPPVDRLPIKTYVAKFNKEIVIRAIMKEIERNGQIFYVSPRIKDLRIIENFLKEKLPNISCGMVHGALTPDQINNVYNLFFNGEIKVLISTSIIESGLDVSNANTIIINKPNFFGLSQLYQIRGRVGRSNIQAYAYLLLNEDEKKMTDNAFRRLEVMKSLDSLGAGFLLANHDMDIRGGGNLVGAEQSGHIREVGIELYQKLIKDAINEIKNNDNILNDWSPTINLGFSVFIPEDYMPDIQIRLNFYRRISSIISKDQMNIILNELKDRFGSIPEEVTNFVKIIKIKNLCKLANVKKIDLGSKGFVISFKKLEIINKNMLIKLIEKNQSILRLRPDNKLLYLNKSSDKDKKISEIINFLKILKKMSKT